MTCDIIPTKKSISIVIPAFNEEENIQGSIDSSVFAAEKNFDDYEIIVVNDGSSDRTIDIVKRNMQVNEHIKVLSHPRSLGFGASFNTGRKSASKHFTVMVHGDDVFERGNLSAFFSYAGCADIILGYIGNPTARNKIRQMISSYYTKIMNFIFQLNLLYFNGIQIHETGWLKHLEIYSDGFGFLAEMVVKAIKQGKNYLEVPYIHRERPGGGVTKIFKLKNIMSIMRTLIHLRRWIGKNTTKSYRQTDSC